MLPFLPALVLLPSAAAHSPHDVMAFVSAAPDGAVVSAVNETLLVTTDRGRTLQWVSVPFGGVSCAVAWAAQDWTVAGRDGGVWRSDDHGATWAPVEGPEGGSLCLRTDELGLLIDGSGVWTTFDGLTWTARGGPPLATLTDVAVADDGTVWALDDGGQAWSLPSSAQAWTLASAGPWATVAAGDGEVVFAAVDGGLYALTGETATPLPGSPVGLTTLALGASGWLGTTNDEAVWVSTDAGGSWELLPDGLDPLAAGKSGGADDGIHYFGVVVRDDAWHLASFEGAYSTDSGGERWHQWPTLALPLVTDVNWLGEREVLTTTTGGGLYRGVPLRDEWADVSAGIDWPWLRQIVVAPAADKWFAGGGNTLYISADEGLTWHGSGTGLPIGGYGVAVHPDFPDPALVLFGGQYDDATAGIARSLDGGETWEDPSPLPGFCRLKPARIAITRAHAWATCGGSLFRSDDAGVSWVEHAAIGVTTGSAVVPAPDGAIFVGTDDGLARVVDTGEPEIVAFEGEAVEALARGADDTMYAAVAAVGVVRIEPDGTEALTAWPQTMPVWALSVSPEGRLAVGTHDGLFLTEDRGESFTLANSWDRYDERVQAWWFDGSWEAVDVSAAKAGEARVGGPGSVAEWEGRFATFALLGAASNAWMQVDVDGVQEIVHVDDPLPVGRLWWVRVDPGWHRVRVSVLSGELVLDGAEAWRDPYRIEAEGGGVDPGGCGCATGGAGAGWAGIGLGLLAALRRYGTRHQSGKTSGRPLS